MDESTATKNHSKYRNLAIRAISALVALAILAISVNYAGERALRIFCGLASLLGTRELIRMLFVPNESMLIKSLYFLLVFFVFALTSWSLEFAALAFAFVAILFFSLSLWLQTRFHSIKALSLFQAKGTLGFVYMGLLPGFALQITRLPNGFVWFMAMLAFVFAGDTCAYLAGMAFGKTPLMPGISPKKTVEGALGGLMGSVLAGAGLAYFQNQYPVGPLLALAGLAGLSGQMGDLFESLLKRVANQKDSGRLMPGHGGVLDRIDGVLFATPVVLAGAMMIEMVRGLT